MKYICNSLDNNTIEGMSHLHHDDLGGVLRVLPRPSDENSIIAGLKTLLRLRLFTLILNGQ